MGRPMWFDDQVISNGRDGATEDGVTKDTGAAVRYCESCLDPALSVEEQTLNPCMPGRRRVWRLVGEFPTDYRKSACKYCLGLKSERPAKLPKGEKFSTYREYVNECKGFKVEEENLRSEYREALRRVKSEEAVIRAEYAARRSDLLQRKKESDDLYKETARKNF